MALEGEGSVVRKRSRLSQQENAVEMD